MALPADFNKIFGSTATGGLTPISDVDYAKGWEFVGANPPTKNDFSYLQNLSDLKSQWLYSNKLQRTDPFGDIKSDGAVKKALSNLGLGDGSGRYSKTVVFSSSGSYTWPADVKRIDVILTAGGGGGGGCNAENANQTFSGAGGGAGGTVFATIHATDSNAGPGTYAVTIGAGGGGANGPGSGNNGGNSSFMTLTALGGQGGQWVGPVNTAGGRGGSGSGGYKTEQGGDGSDGQAGQALLTGNGASSYWGGGGRAGQLSGNPGVCSGSGGGGAYDNSYSHTSGSGGHGANGVLVIREYM